MVVVSFDHCSHCQEPRRRRQPDPSNHRAHQRHCGSDHRRYQRRHRQIHLNHLRDPAGLRPRVHHSVRAVSTSTLAELTSTPASTSCASSRLRCDWISSLVSARSDNKLDMQLIILHRELRGHRAKACRLKLQAYGPQLAGGWPTARVFSKSLAGPLPPMKSPDDPANCRPAVAMKGPQPRRIRRRIHLVTTDG